ncbi:MAG TPA: sensor histidine kinase [Thermoanaerobaculia bacterium]|nr:sensor histidine kinase [Thermoanaerobaculia bacterium]
MIADRFRKSALIFGAWTAAGVFFASQLFFLFPTTSGGREITFGRALFVNLPFYWLWALLTPAILGLARRFPLERARWKRSLAVHAGASVALSAFQLLVAGTLLYTFVQTGPTRTLARALGSFFRLNFHANVLTYAALVALAWGGDTYGKYRDRELAASRLQTELVKAELDALKMQLQPHFLFNTLNAIAALLKPEPEAAERMVLQLAEFLRLTLLSTGRAEVTLREELEFLERYLAIEKTRFGDRLSTRFHIRSEALDARVPNLLLQPLVENAIRHGIARSAGAGCVEVSATRENGRLLLRVTDDGPGLGAVPVREGIGLSNTRERLGHLFGEDFTLACANAPGGGFAIEITFPLVAGPHPEGGMPEAPATWGF